MTEFARPWIAGFQERMPPIRDYHDNVANSVITSHRVRVPEFHSDWALVLQERLNELTSLPIGWDGYKGRPVSFQCACFVLNMLERLYQYNVPAPNLVPGSDGSLQIEWHRNMFDVELDVLDAHNVVATRFNRESDKEEVLEIQNDFTKIVDWISALSYENRNMGQRLG